MVSVVLIIYNLLFPIIFLLYLPFFLTKLIRRGNFREGFWERFGIFSQTKRLRSNQCPRPVWIHAVSVGETVAALSFIREWSKLQPELTFVLSTITSTGQQIARDRAPENVVTIYFPIDFCVCVWCSINAVRPRLLVIFEVEIWPNIIVSMSRRRIPIALVNARMSDKSARGYQRYRWIFKDVFERFSLICTQTEEDAKKIKRIIGDKSMIKVCNTMKFDQVPENSKDKTDSLIDHLFPKEKRIIFTAASTHPGEEILLIKVLQELHNDYPELYTILIPRHVERCSEIERILTPEGVTFIRLTELRKSINNGKIILSKLKCATNKHILLVDTTGEMQEFLSVSDIVFIGNSLAGNTGGHNLIEPALFSKPIIFGPGMDNFRLVVKIFKDNDACIEIDDEATLLESLRMLLDNKGKREKLGRASLQTVQKNRGAISKTIHHLQAIT